MVVVSASCAAETVAFPPAATAQPIPTAVLGPGDVFEVRVYDEKELSSVYRVDSDGSITFPLVGRVDVNGMTAQDAGDAIARNLGRFIRSPQVSVFVQQYNSKKVYVFGQVRQPGTFAFEQGMSIVQAITLAGGFEKLANQNGTLVTRIVDGKELRVQVSVEEIGEGKTSNFALEPGDIVYVPERVF